MHIERLTKNRQRTVLIVTELADKYSAKLIGTEHYRLRSLEGERQMFILFEA